jgi:pilus assembly protein Flp/PilA
LDREERLSDAMSSLARFFKNEEAATAVEYSVMLAMILLVVIGAISAFGGTTNGLWGRIFSNLTANGF